MNKESTLKYKGKCFIGINPPFPNVYTLNIDQSTSIGKKVKICNYCGKNIIFSFSRKKCWRRCYKCFINDITKK